MKNVRRKLRKKWLDYWQDDALDMDKKHLSQYDKRSLLYGGFMVGAAIFIFISIGIMMSRMARSTFWVSISVRAVSYTHLCTFPRAGQQLSPGLSLLR